MSEKTMTEDDVTVYDFSSDARYGDRITMPELICAIVSSIVTNPKEIKVYERTAGEYFHFEVEVDPSDVGLVIGRHGVVADAIKTILKASTSNLLEKGKLITFGVKEYSDTEVHEEKLQRWNRVEF